MNWGLSRRRARRRFTGRLIHSTHRCVISFFLFMLPFPLSGIDDSEFDPSAPQDVGSRILSQYNEEKKKGAALTLGKSLLSHVLTSHTACIPF
jgi:hypothetical protein